MTQKFFTLIYGDQIRAAPKTKVIPSKELSKLIKSSEVFEHVKKDAKKYRQQISEECESIKENAFKLGYEAGFEAWSEQLVRIEKEMQKSLQEHQSLVIPIALKAAKKIVGREIELSDDVIVDIVISTLKTVAQHKKITIFVNRKELDILEKNKPRLKEIFEHLESFSIKPRDDIPPGGCVIETEIGIINAQMEHRWHTLEKAFESLTHLKQNLNN